MPIPHVFSSIVHLDRDPPGIYLADGTRIHLPAETLREIDKLKSGDRVLLDLANCNDKEGIVLVYVFRQLSLVTHFLETRSSCEIHSSVLA